MRPAEFDPAVCWLVSDCRKHIPSLKSDFGRPPVKKILRDKDGTLFESDSEVYKHVHDNVTHIKRRLFKLARDKFGALIDEKRTWQWMQENFPDEINNAIQELELCHPVLTYCWDHWKAKRFLAVALERGGIKSGQTKSSVNTASTSSTELSDNDTAEPNTTSLGQSSKSGSAVGRPAPTPVQDRRHADSSAMGSSVCLFIFCTMYVDDNRFSL
jgi:hypothetical protein